MKVDHVLWTVVDREQRQCGGWHYFYTAVGDAMAILNSSVNFVVYVLTSYRFRRGLLAALGCGRAGRRSAELGTEAACGGGGRVVACRTSSWRRLHTTEPLTAITAPSRWRFSAVRNHESVM